ncbi:MAG TPA: mechanosensitive ion channel family protein [Thermoflexia bacterium]|nr:mechanosensitive ion channel family protein [Thermoflexia bacterium]
MSFSQSFQEILPNVLGRLPSLIAAVVTFISTLLLSGLAARWVKKTLKLKRDNPDLIVLLCQFARWAILLLGTLLSLEQINFDITSFLAGLGIAGFTIGFALQDIARNFVSGILLLIRQPFAIGDAVQVAGTYSGEVLDVNIRDLVLKTWDGERVIIPNLAVFSNPIINYSEQPKRRRTIHIGIGYGQDIQAAMRVFLKTLQETAGVLAEPAPAIFAEELGDSAVTLVARFWVNQKTHGPLDVHSDAVLAINAAAEAANIDLPYPTQTVRLEQL